MKKLVNGFYKTLFSKGGCWNNWFQTNISFLKLQVEELKNLNAMVNNEEIRRVVYDMKPWKAPGPDKFPAGFYQKSWEVVGDNVCSFVETVWKNPHAIAQVNQMDICLIPKVENPTMVNQFRPISLCNTMYKVVSKVIVGRLKKLMDKSISPYQTDFVPGRIILENIVIAREAMLSMERKKRKNRLFCYQGRFIESI